MCAELLPEVLELDDWGYPILRTDAIPAGLESLARKAVDVCPVLALRLAPDERRPPTPTARRAERRALASRP
jgi:ferredoxin